MYDLLIVNGSVVSPTSTETLDVAVNGETIVAVGPQVARGGGPEVDRREQLPRHPRRH